MYILDARDYLPDFLTETKVMSMIVDCLNVLISKEQPLFEEIEGAYNDFIYKTRDYSKLTLQAKMNLISELGFGYILDILQVSSLQLTQLLCYFNLIYALKGKREGLELVLDTLNMVYTYTVWDETVPRGQRFTATLEIDANPVKPYKGTTNTWWIEQDTGIPYDDTDEWFIKDDELWCKKYQKDADGNIMYRQDENGEIIYEEYQDYLYDEEGHLVLDSFGEPVTTIKTRPSAIYTEINSHVNAGINLGLLGKIKNFVRSYMLPWIDVTLTITQDAATFYCYPIWGALTRIKDERLHESMLDLEYITVRQMMNMTIAELEQCQINRWRA